MLVSLRACDDLRAGLKTHHAITLVVATLGALLMLAAPRTKLLTVSVGAIAAFVTICGGHLVASSAVPTIVLTRLRARSTRSVATPFAFVATNQHL